MQILSKMVARVRLTSGGLVLLGVLMMAGCGGSSSSPNANGTATPSFNPPAGSYNASQTVTISDATAGAVLYCTTDGTTPTTSSPQCAQPTTVFKTEFLQAMAVAPGKTGSAVAAAGYVINLNAAATPIFSPAGGTYASAQTVTIADATAGANIYYTVDGSVPTASSKLYTGPVTVSSSETLSSIAIASGYSNSGVASAAYNIGGGVPAISSISPNAVAPGGAGFTLTVNGMGFVEGAVVQWNGTGAGTSAVSRVAIHANSRTLATTDSTPLTTTYVSSTQLTAVVPASLIATSGTIAVTVANPDGTSSVGNPIFGVGAPTLANISPVSVTAGGAGFTLTMNGTNFASGATVQWGNIALTTTFVSSTQLTAVVPTSLIASAGSVTITVTDSAGTSSGATIIITSSAPMIISLSPSSGKVGDPIAIVGQNFGSAQGANIVTFNGTAATVTASSPTAIVAVVPSGSTTGNVVVTVNGTASAGSPFTVTPAAPAITNLSPASASPGGAAFTLTVNGSNFDSSAKVNWNGTALTTTFVNAGQITAAVPANLIASAGTASITVSASGGTSGASTFTTQSSTPTIAGTNPTSAVAGSAGFTLTVNGSNFDSSAKVNWNGTALTTTFVNAGQITAAVPASLIASAGTANITVSTTAGTSSVSNFTVQAAAPTVTGTSPTSVTAGGSAFTLTVSGTSFDSSAKVNWNGAPLTTTYVNGTTVTASVPASLIASAGTSNITVTTNAGTSAVSTFTIQLPAPTITTITPSSVTVGGSAFTLTVNGANFDSSAVVNWNSSALATTRVSSTQLTAAVPANLIASTGTASITVATSAGTSSAGSITIQQAGVPTISTLDPASATAGSAAFLLKVNGTGFDSNSQVNWNGSSLTTIFVSSAELQSAVSASLITSGGTVSVTVSGTKGTSAPSNFLIKLGVPAITGFSPTGANSNDPHFTTLTVNGVNFDSSAVVKWGSTALDTTYVSATQVTATVPASLIASPGTASITVTTTAGVSAASNFTVKLGNPTISSIDPTSVTAGGATFPLKVTGTNFDSSAKINWNGTAQTTQLVSATEVDASIDSSLIATAGSATVTVTNSTGASNSFTLSIVTAAPTVTGINPTSGSSAGGTSVTITGTNFTGATAVKFGSTAVNPTVNSATSITAVSPAGSVGTTVDVTVVTPAGPSATSSADQFTYTAPLPTISGKVLSGPANSGAAINASVQLYAAGTTGYATGSQAKGSPVTTDSSTGEFRGISYDCTTLTAPGDQLYLVATGTTNTKAVLMAALGSCANIATAYPSGVTINEATTIASAYALSAFAKVDATNGGIDVGAPATYDATLAPGCRAAILPTPSWVSTGKETCNYIGLGNAFAAVNNLVDIGSGTARSYTPDYTQNLKTDTYIVNNSTVPAARINALADMLATCVESSASACASGLFGTSAATPAGGTAPADTLQAALDIAQNPGNNVTTLLGLVASMSNPPYPTTTAASTVSLSGGNAPTDLTLALTFTGAGLGIKTGTAAGYVTNEDMAIDSTGNIWVLGLAPGSNVFSFPLLLAEFSNAGKPLTAPTSLTTSPVVVSVGGYQPGSNWDLTVAYGTYIFAEMAIDPFGNLWVGSLTADTNDLAEVSTNPMGVLQPGLPTAGPVTSVAIDGAGNVWAGGYASGKTGFDEYSKDGSRLSQTGWSGVNSPLWAGGVVVPRPFLFDAHGKLWDEDLDGGGDLNLISTANDTTKGEIIFDPYYPRFTVYGNTSAVYSPVVADVSGNILGCQSDSLHLDVNNADRTYDWKTSVDAVPYQYAIPTQRGCGSKMAIDGLGRIFAVTGGTAPGIIDEFTIVGVSPGTDPTNPNPVTVISANGYTGTSSGEAPAINPDPNGVPNFGVTYPPPPTDLAAAGLDGSGNLWVLNPDTGASDGTTFGNVLVEYVGIGAPVVTPPSLSLKNGNFGVRP